MKFLLFIRNPYPFVIMVIILLLINNLFSQTPDTLWTRVYGSNDSDYLRSVAGTTDSCYVTTGVRWSGAGYKAWLLKFDRSGDTLWTGNYGLNNTINYGFEVRPSTDSGFVITGYTSPYGTRNSDLLLIKTDAQGDTAWIRTFGGDTSDFGLSVDETPDHGFITTGYTESFGNGSSDLWLIKVDSLGDWQFLKTYGGSFDDMGNSVRATTDTGFIICGFNSSFSMTGMDGWLLKTDAYGDTIWTKSLTNGFYDNLFSVRQLTDGGYILTGWTLIADTLSADLSLIRTDAEGNTIWSKMYGGDGDDIGYSAESTPDGGFIVCGFTYSFSSGGRDIWILKTDSLGDTLWTKSLGGLLDDEGLGVMPTADNGYVVTGFTFSFGAGYSDGWIIKLGYHGEIEDSNRPIFAGRIKVLGNPVRFKPAFDLYLSEATAVSLKIYDAAGRLAAIPYSGRMTTGEHQVMGPDDLSAGVYFYCLETSTGKLTGKFVVTR